MGVTYPGNVLALKPTNVHFHKGEFTVLLGLSGAGKSTLLRSLNHLVKPTTGKVVSGEFGELTNRRILRQHRSRTAMVFQHHQLIERYTALQNVLTGRLAYHGTWRSLLPLPRQDLELALQCLDRVGLADKALSRVDQLSGGQQQRVAIARAIVGERRLVLADEPTGALDTETGEEILRLLRARCDAGAAGVLVTHEARHAAWADRVVFLRDGVVVDESGSAPVDDLLEAGHA